MNITIYLPDHIGERAKASNLPLSRMLREAVMRELELREDPNYRLALSGVIQVGAEDPAKPPKETTSSDAKP